MNTKKVDLTPICACKTVSTLSSSKMHSSPNIGGTIVLLVHTK